MAENTSGLYLDPRLMEPELSEQEKALRDLFVQEYVKDFDPFQACLRVGFQAAFAVEYAKRFMSEPYVLRRIAELQRSTPENEDAQSREDKALVLSVLRQAAQNGPYASRVQAAAKLASILGLDRPDGGEEGEQALIDAFREFAARAPV
ncbi:terminase small subunit [Pseudomonas phage JG054]|uniref:Terminase small subunit n=1 Tax=Pseudomonas phage JG054 TaxID=1970800 RepID=A0A2H4GY24_9CAUD|nr:terminase small subunit [Pseudomonas phage JG054]ARB11146.1 terminase small subunit [Pseudomonas phage JG054]WBQ35332.1 hypothetical protein [Pseudomonas phage pPA-3099-2aT.3]